MSAQESMEQADHAKEASEENRNIALLIAVIALCLALSETLGKGAQTESIAKNVKLPISGRSSRPKPFAVPWCRRPPNRPS